MTSVRCHATSKIRHPPLATRHLHSLCFGYAALRNGRRILATLGKHVILEMWGCCKDTIDNVNGIKEILIKAAESVNATLVDVVCHRFSPYGVTGVAILAESHIAVHTWPEHGYAAADIFICSSTISPQNAASYLTQAFLAKDISQVELERGDFLSKKVLSFPIYSG